MSSTQSALWLPAPNTTRGQPTRLYSSSSKPGLVTYPSGRHIVVRSLDSSTPSFLYSGHTAQATVAALSPTGAYVASGDINGNLRIWDVINPEHPTKLELKAIAGPIRDIAWDGESQRVAFCGEGKDKSGGVVSIGTGTSVGTIEGHAKGINAIALKPQRPFKAVTGSDDFNVAFHPGVPFKFASKSQRHARYVQAVSFAPGASPTFLSAGSDGAIFLYSSADAAEAGELVDESVEPGKKAHEGTIFAALWSDDGKWIASAGADRTVKLWDSETKAIIRTWTFAGKDPVAQQQVGCCFASLGGKTVIVSLSFSGDLNILDPSSNATTPSTVLYGHQKAITALAASPNGSLVSGSASGSVLSLSSTPEGSIFTPLADAAHTNLVVGIVQGGNKFVSTGLDDALKIFSAEGGDQPSLSTTGSTPRGVSAATDGTVVLATAKEIQIFSGTGQKLESLAIEYNATSVDVTEDGTLVAVGTDSGVVWVYERRTGKPLNEKMKIEKNRSSVTALKWSKDKKSLATGESGGKIFLIDTSTWEVLHSRWVFHTARITSLSFSGNGEYLASGSLDTNIYIWSVAKPTAKVAIKGAHPGGVNAVAWSSAAGNEKLLSAGADGTVRQWDVTFA